MTEEFLNSVINISAGVLLVLFFLIFISWIFDVFIWWPISTNKRLKKLEQKVKDIEAGIDPLSRVAEMQLQKTLQSNGKISTAENLEKVIPEKSLAIVDTADQKTKNPMEKTNMVQKKPMHSLKHSDKDIY